MERKAQKIDYDLEAQPLQVKTDSEAGSGDKLAVSFYNSGIDGNAGRIDVEFGNPMRYQVRGSCTPGFKSFPVTLPEGQDKIWTFSKTETSLGIRIVIKCNNVEVVNHDIASSSRCAKSWVKDINKMKFFPNDTASDMYRGQPGVYSGCFNCFSVPTRLKL